VARLIGIACVIAACIIPAAAARPLTDHAGPQNTLNCWFNHGGTTAGRATTSCIATTFTFRESVRLCRPATTSTTGFEAFDVPVYDVLETDSVYAGNVTAGPLDATMSVPGYHAIKPHAHSIYSDSTPDFLQDWTDAVDAGSCTPS
jgi:hypothetical protein